MVLTGRTTHLLGAMALFTIKLVLYRKIKTRFAYIRDICNLHDPANESLLAPRQERDWEDYPIATDFTASTDEHLDTFAGLDIRRSGQLRPTIHFEYEAGLCMVRSM